MAKLPKELRDMLTEFLLVEIEGKAKDGITYVMTFKNEKDKEQNKRYKEIKEMALKSGFGPNELFRAYEISNGYIYDMDLSVAKYLTVGISKAVAKENNGSTPAGDLIGNKPEERRREDMESLAKHCLSKFKEGKRVIDVALFSRNRIQRIVVNGNDKITKQPTSIHYAAYAVRHWDIEDINMNLLVPAGIRISKIEPCEVLPSKTGVKFTFHLEAVGK